MLLLRAIFQKELIDALRDRRSLLSALLYPLFMPLLMGGMFALIVEREAPEHALDLPIVGAEHAPGLVAYLKRQGVKVVAPPANPEQAVLSGDVAVVLILQDGHGRAVRHGKSAKVRLLFDSSRNDSRRPVAQARRQLRGYSSQLGSLRLVARGVSPTLLRPLDIVEEDRATPKKTAANVLNIIPMLAILACFIGGMQVAIDTTAGERERGSLEALLINPVSRRLLVLGKWLTAVVFALASSALTVTLTLFALTFAELEQLGLQVEFNLGELGLLLCLTTPACLLASALQMLVATFARSFKEAQTYLSLLLFLPMLPGLWLSLSPVDTQGWMLAIPLLSQTQLMSDVLRGDGVGGLSILLGSVATVLLAALCLLLNARLLTRERVIFGR